MKIVLSLALTVISFVAAAQIQLDAPIYPPGFGSSRQMVTGDFDGNGRADVIVQLDPPGILKAFYSNAEHDYTIKQLDVTDGGSNRGFMLAGDVNKDGKDDLLLFDPVTYYSTLVCLSTGQSFDVKPLPINYYASLWDAKMVDYDHDGNLDFVLVGSGVPVQLYKGDGTGNFERSSLDLIPAFPGNFFELQVGNLNGDQTLDYVIVTKDVFKTYVSKPDGTYTVKSINQRGFVDSYFNTHLSLVADFTGDGKDDVITMTYYDGGGQTYTQALNFYRNNGDGTLADWQQISSQQSAMSTLAHGDYDHDGKEDLVIGAGGPKGAVFVLHNTGDGNFENLSPSVPYNIKSAHDVAFVDLDGSGPLEIASVTSTGTIEWSRLTGNTWQVVDRNIFAAASTTGNGVVYDMDHDGIKDLVSGSPGLPGIVIWYGKPDLQYEYPVFIELPWEYMMSLAVGDFNHDNYGDLVYGGWPDMSRPGQTNVSLSTGPRTFGTTFKVDDNVWRLLSVEDFDNDGDIDIYNQYAILDNNGSGQFSAPVVLNMPTYNLSSVAIARFNNDNLVDIAVTGNGGLYIYFNTGSGFTSYQQIELTKAIDNIRVGDLNSDGKPDIVGATNTYVTDHYDLDLSVLTNQGNGQFTESHIPTSGFTFLSPVGIGDIDQDGFTDVAAATDFGSVGVFKGRAGGTFDPLKVFAAYNGNGMYPGGQASMVSISDLDNDSMPDVVEFLQFNIPIVIYPNTALRQDLENPTNLNVSPKDVEATISLTKGNGAGRIIFVRKAADNAFIPVDGRTYTASSTFGGSVDSGNSIVAVGDKQSLTVNGLTPGTDYIVTAFEYRSSATNIVYTDVAVSTPFTTKKIQTINFHNTDGKVVATASSGLSIDLSIKSGSGVVTDNSYTITTTPGTIKLHAAQDGNSVYAAASADTTFCVYPPKPTISVTNQTGVWTSSSLTGNTWYLGDQPIQSATSQTYGVDANGIYKVKVTVDGCGVFSDPVTITGIRTAQTLTITNTDHLVIGSGLIVTATASSGLPVTVTVANTAGLSGNGTINDNKFTPSAAGQIQLHVSQAGNDDYKPVSRDVTFCIYPVRPTLSVSSPAQQITLTASSDANNTWLLNNVQQDGNGKTFTVTTPGTYKVRTSINGCVSDASDAIEIAANKTQVISFINTVDNVFGTGNNTVTATASSGLSVQLTLKSGNGAITDVGFVPSSPGKVTLNALQVGNLSFLPVQADLTFCVNPPKPTISASGEKLQTLTSNSDNNNQWYDGDDPIFGATAKTFTPTRDGFYRVVVTVDGCKNISNVIRIKMPVVVVTGIEDEPTAFSVSPNPATSFVRIGLPKGFVGDPVFVNTIGKQVYPPLTKSGDAIDVDITDLASGMYVIRLAGTSLKMLRQ